MALLRNLATALFERERIRTTLMKAKELRPYAERLITLARREDDRLHARRLAARELQDRTVMKKLFDDLGARFAARPGGYTRILRLGPRQGEQRDHRAQHRGGAFPARAAGELDETQQRLVVGDGRAGEPPERRELPAREAPDHDVAVSDVDRDQLARAAARPLP